MGLIFLFCLFFVDVFWILLMCVVSQRPGRYLETFLDPVAPFSQSISPSRPTTTPFSPDITKFCRTRPPQSLDFLPLTTPLISHRLVSTFFDPSRVVANTMLYRKFSTSDLFVVYLRSYLGSHRELPPTPWHEFGTCFAYIFWKQYIFQKQCTFCKHYIF